MHPGSDEERTSIHSLSRHPVHPDRVHADEDPSRTGDHGSLTIDRGDRRVHLADDDDGEASQQRAAPAAAVAAAARQTGTRSGVSMDMGGMQRSGLRRGADMANTALLVPGRELRAADHVDGQGWHTSTPMLDPELTAVSRKLKSARREYRNQHGQLREVLMERVRE